MSMKLHEALVLFFLDGALDLKKKAQGIVIQCAFNPLLNRERHLEGASYVSGDAVSVFHVFVSNIFIRSNEQNKCTRQTRRMLYIYFFVLQCSLKEATKITENKQSIN